MTTQRGCADSEAAAFGTKRAGAVSLSHCLISPEHYLGKSVYQEIMDELNAAPVKEKKKVKKPRKQIEQPAMRWEERRRKIDHNAMIDRLCKEKE